jgi:phosphoribosyl-ATP pyrophosphohydrolase
MKNYNKLTPAETERLAILFEECSEVIKCCGKILRYGYASRNNREDLARELGDLRFAMLLCIEKKDYDWNTMFRASQRKARKILKYLHHQK